MSTELEPLDPNPYEEELRAEFLRWRKRLPGKRAHLCNDWDGLPIDEESSEWPCICFYSVVEAENAAKPLARLRWLIQAIGLPWRSTNVEFDYGWLFGANFGMAVGAILWSGRSAAFLLGLATGAVLVHLILAVVREKEAKWRKGARR